MGRETDSKKTNENESILQKIASEVGCTYTHVRNVVSKKKNNTEQQREILEKYADYLGEKVKEYRQSIIQESVTDVQPQNSFSS